MTRETIYVTGYPKSGCTWLTRLLAEVLDSPSGGCRPEDDKNEVATEGQDRKGGFVVRKGHFRPVLESTMIVPAEHRLAIDQITDERIVMIHRDPRDMIVSGAHYWRRNIREQIEMVVRGNGSMRLHGAWNEYIAEWMRFQTMHWFKYLAYEKLLTKPLQTITKLLFHFGITLPEEDQIKEAIVNQSFVKKKMELIANPHNPKYDSKFHQHFMHKGMAGEWETHFDEGMSFRVESKLGHWMRYLGYELS